MKNPYWLAFRGGGPQKIMIGINGCPFCRSWWNKPIWCWEWRWRRPALVLIKVNYAGGFGVEVGGRGNKKHGFLHGLRLGHSMKVVSCKLIYHYRCALQVITSCNSGWLVGFNRGFHPSWLVIPQLAWLKLMMYCGKFDQIIWSFEKPSTPKEPVRWSWNIDHLESRRRQ